MVKGSTEGPTLEQIEECDDTVSVNKKALERLVMIAENTMPQNAFDRMAIKRCKRALERPYRYEGYEYGDPCPNCGEDERFGETCHSHGTTYFDQDGNVTDYNEQHVGEPIVVQCLECETILFERNGSEFEENNE